MKVRLWLEKPIRALYVIIPSWLYGLLWSVMPLFGWNSYKRAHGHDHVCGLDLTNTDPSYVSYTYNLLVWCFLIPVLVIFFCCYSIVVALRQIRTRAESLGLDISVVALRARTERTQSIMSLTFIGAFLLAWTPYAVCVLLLTARGQVPSSLLEYAAVIAKTSTLYNPIIYSIFSKDFRLQCKKMFGCHTRTITDNLSPVTSFRFVETSSLYISARDRSSTFASSKNTSAHRRSLQTHCRRNTALRRTRRRWTLPLTHTFRQRVSPEGHSDD